MTRSDQKDQLGSEIAENDPRLPVLAADIAARLRHVCSHLDDATFAGIVADLARLKLRWADRYGESMRLGESVRLGPEAGPVGYRTPLQGTPAVNAPQRSAHELS